MDRNTPFGSKDLSKPGPNVDSKVESAVQTAHATTDRVADAAAAQVDRLSNSAHRAVDSATDAAASAAGWASNVADKASDIQTKAVESASATIRQQPLTYVAGALVIGYLLGRL